MAGGAAPVGGGAAAAGAGPTQHEDAALLRMPFDDVLRAYPRMYDIIAGGGDAEDKLTPAQRVDRLRRVWRKGAEQGASSRAARLVATLRNAGAFAAPDAGAPPAAAGGRVPRRVAFAAPPLPPPLPTEVPPAGVNPLPGAGAGAGTPAHADPGTSDTGPPPLVETPMTPPPPLQTPVTPARSPPPAVAGGGAAAGLPRAATAEATPIAGGGTGHTSWDAAAASSLPRAVSAPAEAARPPPPPLGPADLHPLDVANLAGVETVVRWVAARRLHGDYSSGVRRQGIDRARVEELLLAAPHRAGPSGVAKPDFEPLLDAVGVRKVGDRLKLRRALRQLREGVVHHQYDQTLIAAYSASSAAADPAATGEAPAGADGGTRA